MNFNLDCIQYESYDDYVRFSPDITITDDPFHLPPCEACGKEVKPGEDLCWGCLGESIPVEDWYLYASEDYGSQVTYNTYPVAVGNSIPTTLYFTNTYPTFHITGVSNILGSTSFTFTPPITLINGDSIQIKLGGTIA